MGTFTETDAVTHVYRLLRDLGTVADEQLLTDTEIKALLRQAERRYSLDRPRDVVTDLVADGTRQLVLPATFEDGFSRIVSLESPLNEDPPAYIDGRAFVLYRLPSLVAPPVYALVIRWTSTPIASGTTVRLTHTVARKYAALASDTTVLDADHYAVSALAASICANAIAAKYARTHEPVMSADVASYRSKEQEWRSIARMLETMYRDGLGSEGKPGHPIASGWVNWDQSASDRGDYLFHGRRHR